MTRVAQPTLTRPAGKIPNQDVLTVLAFGADADEVPVDQELTTGCSIVICTYRRPDAVGKFLDSLVEHNFPVARLVIVDASADQLTEQLVQSYSNVEKLAESVLYFRVTGSLRGLTRQRNFSLKYITTDLVVFFDDDIVLLPNCLSEMERVHRTGDDVVGVGAVIQNESKKIPSFWKVRRLLGIVPTLRPGSYCRSGFAVPWNFLPPTTECVEGQWLRGCAMLWDTRLARQIGFNADFPGSSIAEDLDFSLRIGVHGKLIMVGTAHVLHNPDTSGRPDAAGGGYAGIANSYSIHRHCVTNRSWRDASWFIYAYGMDTVMRIVNLLRPGSTRLKLGFLRGRFRFFKQLITGNVSQPRS